MRVRAHKFVCVRKRKHACMYVYACVYVSACEAQKCSASTHAPTRVHIYMHNHSAKYGGNGGGGGKFEGMLHIVL